MNDYVVAKATQGLANYIKLRKKQNRGVAIAFDSRRCSPEFADVAALCLAANGIKAYVFDSLRPTPELSFAVRYLNCVAGINITASHNPPEYNGYKVYWEDGAQITPPHDAGIMKEVKAITVQDALTMPKQEAIHEGLYEIIGKELDDAYMAELKKLSLHPEINEEIVDVWFNTWQFSQFNMNDTLTITFLQHLLNELTKNLVAYTEVETQNVKGKGEMKTYFVQL